MEKIIITMMMMSNNTRITKIHEKDHPTWKLYENPFYTSPQNQEKQDHKNQLHTLHLPISTRKIATSFWDLTFITPLMNSDLDRLRSQVIELQTQLEYEQKARKKAESLNKKLSKELSKEKKSKQALEKVCEELAVEITSNNVEINGLKREMEEERKMIRVAEIFREERVQMKLAEAKIFLEEKMSELEITKKNNSNSSSNDNNSSNSNSNKNDDSDDKEEKEDNCDVGVKVCGNLMKVENPHIKRGIKGFVEFQNMVRRSRHLGTKLECRKSQLMILLKHKSSIAIRSNNLITKLS